MTPKLLRRAVEALDSFQVETPSWGFADTGTRFGKFFQDAAAIDMNDKLADAGQVHALTGCCPTVATHVLWDYVKGQDPKQVVRMARKHGVKLGAINPNVFQDQCYKWGSFGHNDPKIRRRALKHCVDSVEIMTAVGSEYLSLWFADGTNYPGQGSIRERKAYFEQSLKTLHGKLRPGQTMLVEYKPFEPAFYATDLADWGSAVLLCQELGESAKVLVDLGHHAQGVNIEQIVTLLHGAGRLGGFHFNDRKYADDDLIVGSIDPYQLFRIFFELIDSGAIDGGVRFTVDQSHNIEPKIEAMIQTVLNLQEAYAKALLVDRGALERAQAEGDVLAANRILVDAYATDVRPLCAKVREELGAAADPIAQFRAGGYAARVAEARRHGKAAAWL